MPRRSKKHIQPTFSKTKKKTKDLKRVHMEKVRDLVDQFRYIYVFHCENFRNELMKKVKEELSPNVFFMAKIAPTIVALGKSSEDEYRKDLYKLCQSLQKDAKGNTRGLYFGNTEPKDAIDWFGRYEVETVPKTGFVATETFIIRKGALDPTQFNHSQEYQLRQLGLPVQLKNGQLLLDKDFVVCKRGDILKPEQCRLLGLWDQKQAKFRFALHGYWSNDQFVRLNGNQNEATDTNEQDEEKILQTEDYDTFGNTVNDQIGRSSAFFEKLLKGNKRQALVDDDEDDNNGGNEENNNDDEIDNEDGDDDNEENNDADNNDNNDTAMKESNTNIRNATDVAIDDALFLESD